MMLVFHHLLAVCVSLEEEEEGYPVIYEYSIKVGVALSLLAVHTAQYLGILATTLYEHSSVEHTGGEKL